MRNRNAASPSRELTSGRIRFVRGRSIRAKIWSPMSATACRAEPVAVGGAALQESSPQSCAARPLRSALSRFNTDYPDQLRADEFLMNSPPTPAPGTQTRVRICELPSFVLLYLPDDHTGGTRPNLARPAASWPITTWRWPRGRCGSHSPYWDDTAIFVVEDDAQDGADHVDAHRSIAFVISKYSPASGSSATSPMWSITSRPQSNMVHTMEMLLGLPPMNQNDAYAPLMAPVFRPGDQPAYKAD